MHTVRTFGEAMDRGDKATNKAMSAAYKYAAFQTFAIPTEGDNDADASSHEVSPRRSAGKPTDGAWEAMSDGQQAILLGLSQYVQELIAAEDVSAAWDHIQAQNMSSEEKIALWTRFTSSERSALKKAGEAAKTKDSQ